MTENDMQPGPGKVYLVGAGPGDPDLITVRGQQLLERVKAGTDQRAWSLALKCQSQICRYVVGAKSKFIWVISD